MSVCGRDIVVEAIFGTSAITTSTCTRIHGRLNSCVLCIALYWVSYVCTFRCICPVWNWFISFIHPVIEYGISRHILLAVCHLCILETARSEWVSPSGTTRQSMFKNRSPHRRVSCNIWDNVNPISGTLSLKSDLCRKKQHVHPEEVQSASSRHSFSSLVSSTSNFCCVESSVSTFWQVFSSSAVSVDVCLTSF